jgi:hypothetical protein
VVASLVMMFRSAMKVLDAPLVAWMMSDPRLK